MSDPNKLLPFLRKVLERRSLGFDEASKAMDIIMSCGATAAQIASFLTALRMKGESAEEIGGCASTMRDKATRIDAPEDATVVDTCGTGGDESNTFNVSTAAALVSAGAGVVVAKHGNKSVSSRSGSADVLAELGVNIQAPVETVEKCLREARIGFLFAPLLHGAMKHAMGPRREMGIRTIFNILGPLTNPAGAKRQLLGVFSKDYVPLIADALRMMGAEHALVVHGAGGLDEISLAGPTMVSEVCSGNMREYELAPSELGLPESPVEALKVDSVQESAARIRAVLKGEAGPYRDIIAANAAGVLKAADLADSWSDCVALASKSIDSGSALRALDALVRVSNEV